MKFCENLYMLCGYTYSSIDNVYAIDTEQGTILIDTGTDSREYDIIMENLRYWNLKPISSVILTHAHINHCFNARKFQRNGAQIVCSSSVAEAISKADDRLIDYHDLALNFNVKLFEKCKADVVIGESGIYTISGLDFDMRICNGHSKGGLVFFCNVDNKRIMFTGDEILIGTANKHASAGWNGDVDYDYIKYLEELKALSNEEPDFILPGHGQQCLRDAWQMTKNVYLRSLRATHRSLV